MKIGELYSKVANNKQSDAEARRYALYLISWLEIEQDFNSAPTSEAEALNGSKNWRDFAKDQQPYTNKDNLTLEQWLDREESCYKKAWKLIEEAMQ